MLENPTEAEPAELGGNASDAGWKTGRKEKGLRTKISSGYFQPLRKVGGWMGGGGNEEGLTMEEGG